MKIGLYFGSFNPIHIGHLAIAQFMVNFEGFERILFIVSPQNPLKNSANLMDENKRIEMVRLSIADNPNFECSDIEMTLPKPSYTAITLQELSKKYPNDELSIIMGSDALESLPKWKDVDSILKYNIVVYKRTDHVLNPYPENLHIRILETPLVKISATYIRELINENKSVRYLVKDDIVPLLKN
jgi:nicotinate-nucleotide adenylyltransferase